MLIVSCSYQALVPIQELRAQQFFSEFGSYLGIKNPRNKIFCHSPDHSVRTQRKAQRHYSDLFPVHFSPFASFSQQVIMLSVSINTSIQVSCYSTVTFSELLPTLKIRILENRTTLLLLTKTTIKTNLVMDYDITV